MNPRRKPFRGVILPPARPVVGPLDERRRAAFLRAWPLLATSIPTTQIVDAYLSAVLDVEDAP